MSLLLGLRNTRGGDPSSGWRAAATQVVGEFESAVNKISESRRIGGAVIRSRLYCSGIFVLDKTRIWVVGEKASGVPLAYFFEKSDVEITADALVDECIWEYGFEDPFAISFPRHLMDMSKEERADTIFEIAEEWVESEVRRFTALMQLVRINPIFGPADFLRDRNLCFVLMPFKDPLDTIFRTIVQPAVESKNLVCRRADDIRGNRTVMYDIWKSLCEAEIVIAELTGRNPNVFYELGIAHTLGKETILLAQREEERVPFDIAHIRRINYENTASGGAQLRFELEETIEDILRPSVLSLSK